MFMRDDRVVLGNHPENMDEYVKRLMATKGSSLI
jgi:hypothetical protein